MDALNHLGNLNERDYQSYREVFDLVTRTLPAPSLLIYLKAPVACLVDRIHRRGRSIESTISEEYLSLLDSFYDDWLQSFDLCPVLTIRSDDLDFVHQPGHLDVVMKQIQEMLSGKEELVL